MDLDQCPAGRCCPSVYRGRTVGGPKSRRPGAKRPGCQCRGCLSPATPGHVQCFALRRTDTPVLALSAVTPSIVPSGYGPADLQSAYNLPSGTAGSGMTVAVVDAFDLPTAEADLAVYRTQYGLSPCTTANGCFKKVNQTGFTSPLPVADAGWAGEIALDIDMVSATCPKCTSCWSRATVSSFGDLGTSVDTAVALGAMAVSSSYCASESFGGSAFDAYYNHPGVAITVSTADCGYDCSGDQIGASWPAVSPDVIAVGGTKLTRNSSARGWTESAWAMWARGSGRGHGCSGVGAQALVAGRTPRARIRMIADVSAVADPATGVAVYDSDPGVGGWTCMAARAHRRPSSPASTPWPVFRRRRVIRASYLYADTANL